MFDFIFSWLKTQRSDLVNKHPAVKWVVGGVLGLGLLICLLWLYYKQWKANKDLANAIYQKTYAEESKKEIEEAVKTTQDKDQIAAHQDSIKQIDNSIQDLDKNIQDILKQKADISKEIDGIKSWNEVDDIIKRYSNHRPKDQ